MKKEKNDGQIPVNFNQEAALMRHKEFKKRKFE